MENSKKNISILSATLALGMGIGIVSNNALNAGIQITKQNRSIYWLTSRQATSFESLVSSDVCKKIVADGAKKCDVKLLREQDLVLQYLDSNRDGKPDAWRVESNGKIQGEFTGK